MKEQGRVKWFNNDKGYGFIERDSGGDAFVHFKSIRNDGYRSLSEDDRVEFNIVKGTKGVQAEDVTLLKE